MAANPLGISLHNIVAGDAPSTPKPAGFFGEGGLGRILAGAIGDALLSNAGMQQVYAPAMQRRQQEQDEDARWGRRLEMQKQLNPEKPHYWEMNDGSLGMIGPDGKPQVVFKDPTPKANLDPDVTVTLPNGQFYAGPRSGLAQALMGGGSAPVKTAPRGKLTSVQGGLTPPASGGFPNIGPYKRF